DNGGGTSLTKSGVGIWFLPGVNSYSGGTFMNSGTLNFVSGALGSGTVTFTGNSTLQWAAANTQDISSQGLTSGSGVIGTLDTNGNNVTFASPLTGLGGFNKIGLGTLTLSATD